MGFSEICGREAMPEMSETCTCGAEDRGGLTHAADCIANVGLPLDGGRALQKRIAELEAELARLRELVPFIAKTFDYGYVGRGGPEDRLIRLIREHRKTLRNEDDRNYWTFLADKLETAASYARDAEAALEGKDE